MFSIDIDPWITSSSGHCIAQATSGSGPMLTGVVGDLCGPGMVDLTSHNGDLYLEYITGDSWVVNFWGWIGVFEAALLARSDYNC